MITVQDIMADPLFKGFRIVAGHKGLYNEVLGQESLTGKSRKTWRGPFPGENS